MDIESFTKKTANNKTITLVDSKGHATVIEVNDPEKAEAIISQFLEEE
jgi:hypothetical protein